jgi:hypothetical protein
MAHAHIKESHSRRTSRRAPFPHSKKENRTLILFDDDFAILTRRHDGLVG